jgi:hypothetical protein
MRHDETRARHEARAEAFEDAASIVSGAFNYHEGRDVWLRLRALAAKERAACARKPPVRYTEAPETERASGGAWSEREGLGSYPFEALDPWPDNPAEACK